MVPASTFYGLVERYNIRIDLDVRDLPAAILQDDTDAAYRHPLPQAAYRSPAHDYVLH